MFRKFIFAGLLITGMLIVGCKDSSGTKTTENAEKSAPLPPGLILTTAPANPQNVIDAKEKLKAGDEIVVQGRIGGRVEPFVAGRAIFQLVDSSLPTCDAIPEDKCETPWDYCCEPSDQLAAKSVTVQVVGDDGKPLKLDLNGKGGLKPSAKVIIKGKVAEKPDEKTMTVRADAVYVQSATHTN